MAGDEGWWQAVVGYSPGHEVSQHLCSIRCVQTQLSQLPQQQSETCTPEPQTHSLTHTHTHTHTHARTHTHNPHTSHTPSHPHIHPILLENASMGGKQNQHVSLYRQVPMCWSLCTVVACDIRHNRCTKTKAWAVLRNWQPYVHLYNTYFHTPDIPPVFTDNNRELRLHKPCHFHTLNNGSSLIGLH